MRQKKIEESEKKERKGKIPAFLRFCVSARILQKAPRDQRRKKEYTTKEMRLTDKYKKRNRKTQRQALNRHNNRQTDRRTFKMKRQADGQRS